ncbi:hypothetical protein [Mesorhizobium sophorae]|uniref:hypothetical protein n=1 Tax=Mesorhizobium sophorae TaxID=1300294 RepID=UPI00117EF219|nr:hypothetical protein [Mesorhizobium sophorae]
MVGQHCSFCRRGEGYLAVLGIGGDLDLGESPGIFPLQVEVLQHPGSLRLTRSGGVNDVRDPALENPPGTAVKAISASSPARTRCSEFCWQAPISFSSPLPPLMNTMTGRNGAGTTHIPGRSPTWVTKPAVGARTAQHCSTTRHTSR